MQELMCNSIDQLNVLLNERYHIVLESSLQMEDTVYKSFEGFWGKYAEWYPFPEKQQHFIAMCTGFDHKEPIFWFDEKRLVATYQILEDQLDTDDLCDRDYVRWRFDPYQAFHSNETKWNVGK